MHFKKVMRVVLAFAVFLTSMGLGVRVTPVEAATGIWKTVNLEFGSAGFYRTDYGNDVPGGRWVMVTSAGDPAVSTDGDTWTRGEQNQNIACQARSIVYTGSLWVMGCTTGDIFTMSSGADPLIAANWIKHGKAPNASAMTNIAHDGNGTIVVTGDVGKDGAILTSTNGGTSFENASLSEKTAMYGVTYANGKFYAVGKTFSPDVSKVYVSVDGSKWDQVAGATPQKDLRGIAYGNGKLVAAGFTGYIYVSADGTNWSVASAPTPSIDFAAITYGVGKFYAVGKSETIISSVDGVTWETETTTGGSTKAFVNVVADHNRAFAFAQGLFKSGSVSSPIPESTPIANFAETAKTSTTASFNWSALSDATNVIIEQSPKGANTWTNSTTAPIATNATSAIVTGLSPATEYDFRLSVTGGSHAGTSNVVTVKTTTVPVTDFASTGKTSDTASFSWSLVNGAAGIIIQQSPKGANTWTNSTTAPIASNASSAIVTGLSPATEYDFRLVVTGGSNAGTSNVESVKTNSVPVTDFASTGKTSDTASFSWSSVNGAAGILIQQSPKGANTWTNSTTAPIATKASSAIVTGLSPATEYDFHLVVTGGSHAGTSNVVTVKTTTVPVTDFASTGKTSDTASFSWSSVNGAAGIIIQQSPKGANTWTNSTTAPIATNATSAIVTGLSPATEYDFRLSVTGGSHAGTSNVVSVKTTTVPVTDFANTGKTSDTASFSWSLVNGATGIIIQQSPKGTDTWVTSTTAPIATNATSAIVTGLSPATEYDFRLVVTGGSNAGTSNVVSVETNSVPVTDFASTGKTSDTASFSWSLVNGATGMTIQQSPKGADTWVTSTTAPIATNATSAIVTGISPATEYDFRLVVTGGSHAGTSNVESVTTNTLPVADFASTGKTSDTASFSWSSVNGATEMSIQQSPKGADTWVTSTTAPIATNATSAIVTGLSPATEYDFRLVVTGGSHAGTSNVESVTTSAAPPIIIPIGDFNSTGKTSTTANFSWSPAISATTIRIEQSPKGINNWTLASTGTILPTADNTTVIGLRPDTEYDFRLVVLGGMNEGTSNIISLMTDTEPSSDLTYTIAPIENQTLNPLQEGYTSPEVKSITVIRTGSGVLNQLSVELIGANAKNFVITQSANNTLDEHNPMTDFTIKANDGLQPGTYVVTVKVTAANMTDVTFTTTQIINPIETPVIPSAPENLTAFGGNHFVELFWNAVTGADFYKIYMKDASGSYNNEPIATVNSAVYRVQELINGTEYFFKVIAGNSYGESIFSSEASATPKAVPSAPTRVSAQAGDGSATVVFDASQDDGGSPITGYIVMDSTGSIHVTGKESPIIITGLTNGTSYTFTVSAINEAGNSLPSEVSNAVVPNTPTSTPSPLPIPTPAPTPVAPIPQQPVVNTGVDVLVNGKVEKAGTASSEIVNNQKVWTIKVNQKKIEEKLQSEGLGSIVTIPFQLETDVLVAELNGEMVKNMESNQAVLEIKTAWATYTIPAKQINIDSVSEKVGQTIALRDIKVKVEIAKPLPEMLKIINNATIKGNFTIVAPPVNFIVTGTYGGTNIQVDKFNAYVKRTISIPDNIDPHKITTGIVVESDGRIRHVPTKVTNIEGKYYAVINSLTNSTYTVVWHPLEFTDVANHWSKDAVNDMGSRMVIEGTGEGQFSPNRNITRAEFATIIVRGLGLKLESGSVPFSDVKEYDWFSNAIKTAYSYNLIKGYADGTFGPHDQITREEAMVIIAKAMKITNLKAMLPNQYTDTNLHPYSDISTGSEWARDSIAESVLSGIFTGRSNTELAPKAYITRAEVAMIIQRLLKKSDLI